MSPLEDELALHKLMARYVDAANRRDGETWSSTWAEDGCWLLMGTEVSGRNNILGLWKQVLEGFEFALLMPGSGHFEIDGDTATGRWYLQEFTRDLQGEALAAISCYDDSYVKVAGQWLFARREYNILYRGPADLSGEYTPMP